MKISQTCKNSNGKNRIWEKFMDSTFLSFYLQSFKLRLPFKLHKNIIKCLICCFVLNVSVACVSRPVEGVESEETLV